MFGTTTNRKVEVWVIFLIGAVLSVTDGAADQQRSFSFDGFQDTLKRVIQPTGYYRLNTTWLPTHYTIRMRPVLDDGYLLEKFTSPNSSVIIRVESVAVGSSNEIVLHQRNLTIHQNLVTITHLDSGRNIPIVEQSFEQDRDLYRIVLGENFQFGEELEIYIPYDVALSQTENVGIYLGNYVDKATNETRYLSQTKLEPYHARKVFPAFDEPSLKARFKIIVGRLDGKYHSLSNMEIVSTVPDLEYDGWVWDHFEDSILMSPYLVCIIVSDFANTTIEIPEKNRTVSTWAIKDDMDEDGGVYGAVTGARIVDYFENKFKMEYPLRKLDAAALPQFASGAMEQFGLVTYRYSYLVWIPGEGTEAERRKVTQVLGHEIAHQWYGNAVTCAWWSEIWLNEGFARYLQFWAMNATIPEFEVEEAMVHDTTQLAMVFDQGSQTHPVKNSAESPTESSSVFDRISYEKGAALLNMMEAFLTRPVFEAGIIDVYLQKMKWKSAFQDDFFEAIQEAIEINNAMHLLPPGTTMSEIMAEWTLTSGYPLVRVAIVDHETVSISQEKFNLNNTIVPLEEEGRWWIPVTVVASAQQSKRLPDLWIPNNVDSVSYSRTGLDTSKWIMVNPDATGYYRVLYEDKLFQLIRRQFQEDHVQISSTSRSQLIDDYFNLALAKYSEIESALQLTEYLGNEIASNVWTTVMTHLKPIFNRFTQDKNALDAFKNYTIPRLYGALTKIDLRQPPEERGINVTLRAQLLDLACQLDLLDCAQYAKQLMEEWQQSPGKNPFPVDIRSSLICTAVASMPSNKNIWDFVAEKFIAEQKEAHKTLYLNALACSRDEIVLSSLLQMSTDPDSPFSKHKSQVLTRVATNSDGRRLAYEFVKDNLNSTANIGPITPALFAQTITTLSGYWNQNSDIIELQEFIDAYESTLQPVKASLDTSIRNIHATVEWWQTFGNSIRSWMQSQEVPAESIVN